MPESKLNVILLKHTQNPEETISHAAKLCYSSAGIEELKEKIDQNDQNDFINTLLSIGHTSPFEHISFTFGVEGISRACSHQLVRHRLASFSQQSQRYVGEDSKAKGETFSFVVPPSIKRAGKETWYMERMEEIQKWYDQLAETLNNNGENAFEDARFILPNAVETKIVITMNARELLHFFKLRCCNRAQWEIRELATEMLKLVKKTASTVFKNGGPGCVNGKCTEGKMTCGKMEEVKEKFSKI